MFYPLVIWQFAIDSMVIEIVSFPIKKAWWFPRFIVDFPIQNGDFPIKNGDFPIKNGDFPIQNGDFPIQNGDFPSFFVNVYQAG